jgi:hypothetical protein
MDVSGGRDVEGQNIIVWNKHNGLNQQWDIIYVKDMPAALKDCEMNKEFHLKVNCDFHI